MNSEMPISYIEQSAAIPYRWREGKLEVLLITSRKRKRWVIPKGIVEPGMTPQDSAAKEAEEEAGVTGQVIPNSLGTYTYPKWGKICRVEVFLLAVEKVESIWLENYRDRQWLSLAEAVERVEEVKLKQILRDLPRSTLSSIT